jgi:taurine dioxygenase
MTTISASRIAPLSITPLSSSIGVQIEGVDFSHDISTEMAEQIRDAFARHFVLVFRGNKNATPEAQLRLAALFGEPQPLAVFQFLGAKQPSTTLGPGARVAPTDGPSAPKPTRTIPEEMRELGICGEFDGWHSDSTFTPWLPRAAVLRAEVIPPVGGDTSFSSLCAAYDALSPTMQRWLTGIEALHVVPEETKAALNLPLYGPDAEARFDAEYQPRRWPLVIAHPETGRRALFLNPSYTAHVVGLKRAESHALLRFLFRHIISTSFVYRHHWRPGDVVVWDELTTLHRAPDDFAPHDRKVIRVTAGRVVPTAPV